MAKFAFSIAAALALIPAICAVPTSEPFSIEKWVKDIISDPAGHHLSPEEAAAAFKANSAGLKFREVDTLEKRDGGCNNHPTNWAYSPDAVWCIQNLAAKGSTACEANTLTIFCTHGRGQIAGVVRGSPNNYGSTSCQHVAEIAGKILDRCWRSDNMVQGWETVSNTMQIHVLSP
ncbi:hypothetical protein TOPH_05999 [Tolypocladium ophioglossoides CBS 100239]|uniref:Ecp2 effector protein domain-containing protein n=1 Tax=Tolypocladium ophioglossoides (strain CBS 100239) TaxID=1163406 RepID=A0A0L0N5J4_TOLOC|nr:hypothetical protein TOPH_05999 [Tolypocladium ophioglossoides CBS 100239]